MKNSSIVSSNIEACVIDIDREPNLKLTILCTSYQSVKRKKFVNTKSVDLYIPLWALPYVMRNQRTAIANHEKREMEFLKRIKDSFNTEVTIIK